MVKGVQTTGFICFAAALGGLLFGFDTAVISGTIQLVNKQFNMNAVTEGWFVSSGLLGSIIGVIIAGLLSDKIGRKNVLILSAVLFLASGLGCAWSDSADMLVWYRLVGGIGVGVASVISPMYIAEFAPARSRGKMISLYQLAITVGILLAYFSNAFLLDQTANAGNDSFLLRWLLQKEVWRSMFLVMAIPSLVFMLALLLVPESPRWLLLKGKTERALSILKVVRGESAAAEEYKAITASLAKNLRSARTIFSKDIRPLLLIGVLLAVFQQFSGINAIIYYGPKIFAAAGLDNADALYSQVIIGVVNVIFTGVAISLSDKWGRKPLLIWGLSGIISSLVVVGACFYTDYTNGPLLLGMLLLFIACFALSLGPITWILINEIFPGDVRVRAVSFCTLTLWMAVWLVGQFFPWLLESVGAAGIFWIFAGFSTLNLLFCLKILVETKGKTLEEIENIFVAGH
ncbi:MAG: sugar porter family MFS transporter [Chitinophagaceae bacterium]